jgi:hypothetical protein
MSFPYLAVFGILLLVYVGYSLWERLDPRYPIGAALVLLVATAITEAVGASPQADTLAEYVFLLLVGGVVLMLLDQVRPRAGSSPRENSLGRGTRVSEEQPTDPADQGELPSQEPLDDLEQKSVAPVDAAGGHDDQDEQPRHGESHDGERPVREGGVKEAEQEADGNPGQGERDE